MNFIILFGPPAVGKMTVGQELSKLTGYSLLHNHMTIDLVTELFDFGTPAFGCLVQTAIDNAIKAGCAEATVPTRRAKDFYLRLGFVETATYLKRKIVL